MTRKDYVAIAEAIRESAYMDDKQLLVRHSLIERLSTIFQKDNQNFDIAKFSSACYKGVK